LAAPSGLTRSLLAAGFAGALLRRASDFSSASGPAASAFPRRKSLRRRPPDLWKGWRIDPFVPDPMVETLRSAERTAGRWKVALALPLLLWREFYMATADFRARQPRPAGSRQEL